MLTILSKTGKVQKEVFVIRRIEITRGEQAGRIIHIVRSVKVVKKQTVQNDYHVITFADQDGRVTCDCESRGDCCHMLEAASYDMRRCNSITRKAVQPVIETAATETELLEQVNEELAKVQATPATQEETEATRTKLLLPNSVDQIVYFLQQARRSAEYSKRSAIKPVPTPAVRNVNPDWLLGRRNGGTFSGRVAQEVA